MGFKSSNGEETRAGYCRRYPPTLFVDPFDEKLRAKNPTCIEHSICGEHETVEEFSARKNGWKTVEKIARSGATGAPRDPQVERRVSGQERFARYLKEKGMSALDFAREVAENEHPGLDAAKQKNVQNWLTGMRPSRESRELIQDVTGIPADSWVETEDGMEIIRGLNAS
jgi:hypothetical protein